MCVSYLLMLAWHSSAVTMRPQLSKEGKKITTGKAFNGRYHATKRD